MARAIGKSMAWRVGLLAVVAGVVAATAIWLDGAPRAGSGASAAAGAHAVVAGGGAAASTSAVRGGQALPASLAGSSVPRLPIGDGGHLLKTRAVRDFFDYLLTAQDEVTPAELDALVQRQIAVQLDGTPAQAEALKVWGRYRLYQDGLAHLPAVPASPDGKPNFDAVQLALDQRAALASRTMGDWNEAFFGEELQHQQLDLERMRIASDPSLSDAQKAARLQALEQQLPPEERAALERTRKQQQAIDTIAQLQKQGASAEQLRSQVTQALGPDAAARVAQMQSDEDAWHAKYSDYAAQRSQIEAMGLPAQERDAQIVQLRQRLFPKPGEAMRAASLDGGS